MGKTEKKVISIVTAVLITALAVFVTLNEGNDGFHIYGRMWVRIAIEESHLLSAAIPIIWGSILLVLMPSESEWVAGYWVSALMGLLLGIVSVLEMGTWFNICDLTGGNAYLGVASLHYAASAMVLILTGIASAQDGRSRWVEGWTSILAYHVAGALPFAMYYSLASGIRSLAISFWPLAILAGAYILKVGYQLVAWVVRRHPKGVKAQS